MSTQKVSAKHAIADDHGRVALARGKAVAMRMWRDEEPEDSKSPSTRPYETVGYVVRGRAELHVDGSVVKLEPGDSWVVPAGASHTYTILETFTAIEATSPVT